MAGVTELSSATSVGPVLFLPPEEDAADLEGPFALNDDSPLLQYEGAEVLQKPAACPA